MDYYQTSSFAFENGYYTQMGQVPYDNAYYNYSSPPQSSAGLWSYEFVPTQSVVAYSNCYHDSYSNSGSIQYSVYHSVANPTSIDEDVDFVEYDPHPYSGGYDISETYGKPLDPSDVICHPRSTLGLVAPSPQKEATIAPAALPAPTPAELPATTPAALPAPTPAALPAPTPAAPADDEDEDDFSQEDEDEDEEDYDGGDGDGSSLQVYDERVVNEIPPGYGLAEFDLCENLFGYWPCLSRMSEKCGSCGNEKVVVVDDFEQWKRTADYLFGNPDPYGGLADQGGYPSGNPVYAYDEMQYYHHPALTMYEKANEYGQNSCFL